MTGDKNTLRCRKGFTLIELMIVVTIIGILAVIAVPNYQWGVIRAREAVLREDLYSIRSAIDQFYADQGKYPDTLEEIKEKHYLRDIPKDPFTNKNDTWQIVAPPPETVPTAPVNQPTSTGLTPLTGSGGSSSTTAAPPSPGNVFDVKSGSPLMGSNGIPHSEW